MRDPKRLDSFYEELRKIHAENFPDWRFGQFISNFFGWIYSEKKMDIWFPEEDKMLELLRSFVADTFSRNDERSKISDE